MPSRDWDLLVARGIEDATGLHEASANPWPVSVLLGGVQRLGVSGWPSTEGLAQAVVSHPE
jgi:hypothetical protein